MGLDLLDLEQRENMDEASAVDTILAHPTLVKRPLLDTGHERITGFSKDRYREIFNQHTL